MEDKIKAVINGLSESLTNENEEQVKKTKEQLLQEYPRGVSIQLFSCLAEESRFFLYQLSREFHKPFPEKVAYYMDYLWVNYESESHFLASLIQRFEGSGCVYDKAYWLLDQFLVYLETENTDHIKMEKQTGEYWKPPFGTAEDWMMLIKEHILIHTKMRMEYVEVLGRLIDSATKKETN